MTASLIRLLDAARGFVVAIHNVGWVGAIRIFLLYRRRIPAHPVQLHLKGTKSRFFFRGAADRGVLSHLHKEGYRIRDRNGDRVRFIVDAGANIGDETLRFRVFHPDAFIVAIEPEPANYALLKRNVSGDDRIVAVNKGLWSHVTTLSVLPGSSNEGFSVVESPQGDTAATAIPELMSRFGYGEIDILKLDIEGAEAVVVPSGASTWLAEVKVLIFECPDHEREGATMAIFQALNRCGRQFRCAVHGENIIAIRADVSWRLESALLLPGPAAP